MKRTLEAAARALGASLIGADGPYEAVSTDSRTLLPGALFVALRGPNFDGADFVAAAFARCAAGAILERPLADVSIPQIVVPDALRALQRLAVSWRADFSIPVVGVAGSNGKTTTKEMTSAILSRRGPCLATRGNLNNHIGVPLTLLRLERAHESAVVEMGANRVGDVAELVALASPTVGLITNAGAEHLEGFGDLDGVARGEGEMVAGLEGEATAVINADDAYADYWRGAARVARVVTFGVRRPADFKAAGVASSVEEGGFVTRFTLECPLGRHPIVLRAGGAHNVLNSLAAAAAAAAAGASLEDIAAGLGEFRAVSGRLQLKAGRNDSWIIDDSYNANPSSVRAGIDVLRSLEGPAWLVLADMAELGGHAAGSHAELGTYARTAGVARVFASGPDSARAVETFGAGGEWFADVESLIRRVEAEIRPGVTVLIKGSRVNRLERVVQALVREPAGSGAAKRAS
jgi:UDP-N-acetylmuramoyl-tripeptide--D-alanyl-D-alanine ligase